MRSGGRRAHMLLSPTAVSGKRMGGLCGSEAAPVEDSLAAGALGALLTERDPAATVIGNDELSAAIALWQNWRQDPEACLRTASHGQRLIGLGDHDADFRCCAGLDQISVVPTQIEPGVLKAA